MPINISLSKCWLWYTTSYNHKWIALRQRSSTATKTMQRVGVGHHLSYMYQKLKIPLLYIKIGPVDMEKLIGSTSGFAESG
jgi:hypothetical protein